MVEAGAGCPARWITGEAASGLSAELRELTSPRDGWQPQNWAWYLDFKAEKCRDVRPDLAKIYRQAAELMRADRKSVV